jgi:hypothetical protein
VADIPASPRVGSAKGMDRGSRRPLVRPCGAASRAARGGGSTCRIVVTAALDWPFGPLVAHSSVNRLDDTAADLEAAPS